MARPNRIVPRWNQGGNDVAIVGVAALGVSTVTDNTVKIVGVVPRKCEVTGIKLYGQAAVTATTLTALVYARTAAGADGNALCSAVDIEFASAAAAKTGVAATLSTTLANLKLDEGQLIELHVDASSATAGPGDVLVKIDILPIE